MKDFIKIAVAVLIMAAATSCERFNVRHTIKKEKNAKVVWMRQDSCYSVTRPLMSASYNASKATRAWLELAHADLMQLSTQMKDRTTDHGGLKVKCYWVGYTHDGITTDSTVVMVEPSGELVTDYDETIYWLEVSEEIGKISNFYFSK